MANASPNPFGSNFRTSEKSYLWERRISELKAENARRVRCEHCGMMILPEGMERHLAVIHAADEANDG